MADAVDHLQDVLVRGDADDDDVYGGRCVGEGCRRLASQLLRQCTGLFGCAVPDRLKMAGAVEVARHVHAHCT